MDPDRNTDELIVAVYESMVFAEAAVGDLKRAGVPEIGISLHAGNAGTPPTAPVHGQGFGSNIFAGKPDHDASLYGDGAADGVTIVIVKTPEALVSQALEILESHEPIDVDVRTMRDILTQSDQVTRRPPVATMPVPKNRAPGEPE